MAEAITKDDLIAAVTAAVAAALGANKPAPARPAPRKVSTETTGRNTHRANQRGYDSVRGIFYEAGDLIDPGVVVSDTWMDSLSKREGSIARAMDEALSPNDADVNVEELSGDALTAYAAGLSINRGSLNDKNLRLAVTAKRADTA